MSSTRSERVVLALSGGLDSTTTLAVALELGWEVRAVSFDYLQVHVQELEAARHIMAHYHMPHRLINLEMYAGGLDGKEEAPPLKDVVGHPQPPTYVPFRNLIIASHLFNIAEVEGATRVGFGFHRSDTYGYWDTTHNFLDCLERIAHLNRKVIINPWAPFINKTKVDVAQEAVRLNVPIHLTYSCYRGGPTHCGECATCVERNVALIAAGYLKVELP